jgi:hypothetical protein
MSIQERLFEQRLKNHCCSQTIMALSLEDLGKENEDLVQAMAAFCNGMGKGKICGTLAAAIAVLHVADPKGAVEQNQEELMDWFLDRFGGYDCEEIVHDDPLEKIRICPMLVEETYEQLRIYLGMA